MITLSTQPPKYPEIAPTVTPISRDTATAMKPTVREMYEPFSIREKTSRPRLSVPSQCAAPGGLSLRARLVAFGS